MAGVIVGEAILSSALKVLFEKMGSQLVRNFFQERKLSYAPLKKLKITLLTVNAVLDDAEEKQITNLGVKAWLDELQDATYEAEDLLDEIATEALRCKIEAEAHTNINQVWNFFSTSVNPFDEGIMSKIEEILEKLEYIAKQKDVLGLKEVIAEKPSQKLPTSSLVEASGVYGRDDDKKEIIKSLLSDDVSGNDIRVITIVGMGGLGKTTLAQYVYNDDEVKKHFDMKAWVCVSEEFDVLRVTRTIIEAVTSSTCDIKDLNMLQVKLMEIFSGKMFLLILDDVWNDDFLAWDVLRSPFRFGVKGSSIIVTTRNESVASIMHTVPIYHLKHLLGENCWLLFEKHAFNNGNSSAHSHLEVIGREIVKRCKGLPLAIKALGGLLRSKPNATEWNKILKSNLWDLPPGKSNIIPALRLSYYYLPSHLKRCFAYCSIFPKDYEFKMDELVVLWMAEEFLDHLDENKLMEEVGEDYFHDLISRSFFQQSSSNESRFVMHDLINDLAQLVSGKVCSRLEQDNPCEISEKTRHLSYFRTVYDVSKKFKAFNDAKCSRTFLPLNFSIKDYQRFHLTKKVSHDLLSTRSCLRVLSLSRYRNISDLPESIGNLKHLRYLDISFTAIRRLPDSIGTLFNLQTLLLSGCEDLIGLPANLVGLINLRNLDVGGTKLKEMPMHMSRLKNLQKLSTFIVGDCNGSTIAELREFRFLHGALHIMELQKVGHARDSLQANLKNKEYLNKLVLEWSINTENSQIDRDVLDKLQPHANLKELVIKNYGGTRFPVWLVDHSLCNMVHLSLENCKYCFSLPSLGQLPFLKELSIKGFDGVERVGPEFYGNGSSTSKAFGSLEILRFEEMLEWEEWSSLEDGGVEFPRLRELYIEKCPKLRGAFPGHLPCLTTLVISKCAVTLLPRAPAMRKLHLCERDNVLFGSNDDQMTTSANTVGLECFSRLEEMKILSNARLKELPTCLQRLAIKFLEIHDCPSLESFPRGGLPATLKTLWIRKCGKLELIPREAEGTMHNYYASIESLRLNGSCDSLKSFPLGLFPKLNYLLVFDCKNLESLCISEEGLHDYLTSLRRLEIWRCPKLVCFHNRELPTPNLTCLSFCHCENLKSLPERMHTLLPSLRTLRTWGCPELESFPEGGLPSNLTSLIVCNCNKLTAHRMQWGLQTLESLQHFMIGECEEVDSFLEEGLLPSTLTGLRIKSCPNLKNLDKRGLQHLTSLEKLYIWDCPKLQCLPEVGLPTSLSFLEISQSPLLEQRCERGKGEDWPKIAHIPSIVINDELIS